MSANLYLAIPLELKQYQLFSEEKTDNYLTNDLLDIYLNNNKQECVERTEYFSATGELLKRSLYEGSLLRKEIFFINGRIGTEKEFDKNKVGTKKTYDKDGNIVCTTLYVYKNDLIIGIIKKKNNNEYKISYSYDEAKRIINRSIYINQVLVNKQIYNYDRDSKVIEYRDNNQSIKICQRTQQNELEKYIVNDIFGNKIEVYNHFENGEYVKTEITLNEHKTVIRDENYVYNLTLQKPQANEDDLNLVLSNLWRPAAIETNNENETKTIFEFIKNKELADNILPITIRKHALVI